MRWTEEDSVGPPYDLTFTSPFSSQEIYLKALHFPTGPFLGKGIESGACQEVTLIPYMETAPDIKTIDSISSKAFCRNGLKGLSPLGQIAFEFDHADAR
jgi:hypothetical protein